ncbi:MAG: NADH-quinone oxidoreductase subunit C [Campylobacterota bacterium]|nr:NADH-quinone oxidoreductase subunit C [Campylobacterota bacterium]
MRKIETTYLTLLDDLMAFYKPEIWHFLTLNGIDLGEGKIELQWIFSKYGAKDETVVYYASSDYETPAPSIVSLIPSAIMGEREVVDMFGVTIDGAEKGLYLDGDSLSMPLRCSL